MKVTELSMEDKGIPAVPLRVSTVNAGGAVVMVNVKRLMARVRLQVQHINGTVYRPRFFRSSGPCKCG
ncbi:MAG: hypothetical protein HC883_02775 [Bdellovibrionaceae bacterium]|nr:hypothetical protein [Pseudobdellovibrionaceae bacterium]